MRISSSPRARSVVSDCPVSFHLAAGQECEPQRSSESHLKFSVSRNRWKAVCSIRLEELLSCLNVCSSIVKLCFTEFFYYSYVRLDHIKLYGQQTGAGMKFLWLCFDFHKEKKEFEMHHAAADRNLGKSRADFEFCLPQDINYSCLLSGPFWGFLYFLG